MNTSKFDSFKLWLYSYFQFLIASELVDTLIRPRRQDVEETNDRRWRSRIR